MDFYLNLMGAILLVGSLFILAIVGLAQWPLKKMNESAKSYILNIGFFTGCVVLFIFILGHINEKILL